jgi:hypothetical protein
MVEHDRQVGQHLMITDSVEQPLAAGSGVRDDSLDRTTSPLFRITSPTLADLQVTANEVGDHFSTVPWRPDLQLTARCEIFFMSRISWDGWSFGHFLDEKHCPGVSIDTATVDGTGSEKVLGTATIDRDLAVNCKRT